MIVIAAEALHSSSGEARGASCAKVASSSVGDVAMAVSCGELYESRESTLACTTCVHRFALWFDERLPAAFDSKNLAGRSFLRVVEREWRSMHASLGQLFTTRGREVGRPLGCSVSAIFAIESLYLRMLSGRGSVYFVRDACGADAERVTCIGRDAWQTNPSAPQYSLGTLSSGDMLIASARYLEERKLAQHPPSLSSDSGQDAFEDGVANWLAHQQASGVSVACLGYRSGAME